MSNINELTTAKSEIKTALENKGCVIDVGMIGYGDKIRGIRLLDDVNSVVDFKSWMTFEGSTASDTSLYEMFNKVYDTGPYGGRYDFHRLFYGCENLITSPSLLGKDDVKPCDCGWMFYGCKNLITAPDMDTSMCCDFARMFDGCSSLTSVPKYTMRCKPSDNNGISVAGMFNGCSSLTSVPNFDLSYVQFASSMFNGCSSLTSVSLSNTQNIGYMDSMFYGCSSLTTIPQINTSGCTDMKNMFYGCSSLTTIPELNCEQVMDMRYTFYGCTNLTTLGGFKNIGSKSWSLTSYGNIFLDLSSSPNLSRESVLNVFNKLYDRNSMETLTIKLHEYVFMTLYTTDIAIATKKGWIVSS